VTRDVSSELADLLARGEGGTVEFKRSLTKDVGRGLCAFANAGGGTVVLGVSDSGKIVGVADHNRLKSRVLSTARDGWGTGAAAGVSPAVAGREDQEATRKDAQEAHDGTQEAHDGAAQAQDRAGRGGPESNGERLHDWESPCSGTAQNSPPRAASFSWRAGTPPGLAISRGPSRGIVR